MTEENVTTPEPKAAPAKQTRPRKSPAKKSSPKAAKPPLTADGTPTAAVATAAEGQRRRTATVNLPFVTAEFRMPAMHMPSAVAMPGGVHLPTSIPRPSLPTGPLARLPRPHVPEASRRQVTDAARVVGSHLPEPSQLALFAGLGAGAVVGVLEWPVAAAVAAATVVARRDRERSEPARAGATDPPAETKQSTRTPSGTA